MVPRMRHRGSVTDTSSAQEALPRWARPLCVTVDGPSGSGKSTLARLLAESIGFQYVDTGATYRALGWLALQRGIPLDDGERMAGLAVAQPASLAFAAGPYEQGGRWTVRIAGHDVTDLIRTPQIDDAASQVARHQGVRKALVAHQQALSHDRDTVLDGRDCGTTIRPDADLKLHVTASLDERVRRRADQQQAIDVAESIARRDERDRPQSGIADDAITVDTTGLSIDDSLRQLIDTWLQRRADLLDGEEVGGRTAREWIDNDFSDKFDRTMKLTRTLWERGFRLTSHGEERVPNTGCLFIANHSSMWDSAFVIAPLNRPIRYMAKRELVTTPVVKDLGDSIGMFPVRRGAGDRVALHIGESILRRGDSLGIFPEGTRIYEGTLSRPRAGAARLALVASVPVVPVAIYGNRWRESLFKVSVAYGKPHYFTGQRATPANVLRATEQVWADVVELWHALKADRRW